MKYFKLIIIICIILPCSLAAAPIELYVATNGNDNWSGRLLSPNSSLTDGPFATLEGARNKVRQIKRAQEVNDGVIVNIRSGRYELEKTFVLSIIDGGVGKPVIYRAYRNENVVISGGKQLETVERYKGNILKYKVPNDYDVDMTVPQLFLMR